MSMSNPTFAPPTLLSSERRNLHNRSPSHSPIRLDPRERDPLLRDLSPTTTLRLFVSEETLVKRHSSVFDDRPNAVSNSERALGIKAAQACLEIRVWARELESWSWPGDFDPPADKKQGLPKSVVDGEYWACLPSRVVADREKRIRQITNDLECIDVEELKDFALSAHHESSNAILGRREGSHGSASVRPLADYTTLITATILQALPYLSRVVRYLSLWTVRLAVCRKAPEYVRDLDHARRDLETAWEQVDKLSNAHKRASLTQSDVARDSVAYTKATMQTQIHALGTCLDQFLDDLEGRDETIPDSWIDSFERLEAAYAEWVVQADRRLLEYDWFRNRLSVFATFPMKDDSRNNQDTNQPAVPSITSNEKAVEILNKSSPGSNSHFTSAATAGASTVTKKSPISSPARNQETMEASPRRARHVPIILDYDGDGQDYPSQGITGDTGGSRTVLPKPFAIENQPPTIGSIRKRSPFLNGQIEKAESLQKQAASPVVRPFEHASTAFTRLFKKDKRPAVLDRTTSESSLRSNSSSIRQDLEILTRRGRQQSLTPLDTRSQSGHSPHSVSSLSSAIEREVSREPKETPANRFAPHAADRDGKLLSQPRSADSLSAHGNPENTRSALSESPKLMSSPFPPLDEADDLPENWPLRSPSPSGQMAAPVLEFNEESHIHPNAVLHSPSKRRQRDASDESNNSKELHNTFQHEDDQPHSSLVQAFTVDSPTLTSTFGDDEDVFQSPQREQPRTPVATSRIPRHLPTAQREVEHETFITYGPMEKDPLHRPRERVPRSASPFDDQPDSLRRASYASIESHPRSAVRSIEVPRRTSYSSRTPSEIFDDITPVSANEEHGSFTNDEVFNFPSPPTRTPKSTRSPISASGTPMYRITDTTPLPSSPLIMPSSVDASRSKIPGLVVTKQRQRAESHDSPPHSPVPVKGHSSKAQPEDSFDRHVSEVVQRLHSNIRFKSRPGAETPIFSRPSGVRNPLAKSRGGRALGVGQSMTIAPAETGAKKSSTTAEPVKLYHLRQEGREEPIKLFVRLVGEDERVMVRVGGGWADLADYLRQYADHHGSRTVSGNALEVLPADTGENNGNGGGGIRRVSGPADSNRARTPVTPGGVSPRPDSSDEGNEWSRPALPRLPPDDSPRLEFVSANSPFGAATTVRTPTTTPSGRATPKSLTSRAGALHSSRPSTPDSATAASLSGPRRSAGGPSSDHKARWVEGMIERAKASAEQDKVKPEREKFFGEIGRIGATRRVIFRSSSSAGGPAGSETSASTAAAAVAAAVAAAANTRSDPPK